MTVSEKTRRRYLRIQEMLGKQGRVSVLVLSEALGVSAMTVRRDIEALEQSGVVLRTHGGCILRSPFVTEAAFPEKESRQRQEKQSIASQAVRGIASGMSLYLDTGTTCLYIARLLPPDQDLTVFTNNIRIATELLGRSGIDVIVYGGQLSPRNPDLTGDLAIAQLVRFRVDLAFLGGDALDPRSGTFYAADRATAVMTQAIRGQADQAVAVIDSSKIGKRGPVVAGCLDKGLTLITDAGCPAAVRKSLRGTGARLVIAR